MLDRALGLDIRVWPSSGTETLGLGLAFLVSVCQSAADLGVANHVLVSSVKRAWLNC